MPPSELMLTMRPPPDLLHQPRAMLAAEEDGLQIHRVNEVPIGFGDLERVEASEARGVVHQSVQAAELLFQLLRTCARFRRRSPGWRGTVARRRTPRLSCAPRLPTSRSGWLRARPLAPAAARCRGRCAWRRRSPALLSRRRLDGRLSMHLDFSGLHALAGRFRQTAGHVGPAPEDRGGRAQHARNRRQ